MVGLFILYESPLCGNQLIPPETTIGLVIMVVMLCPNLVSLLGYPAIRLVNRGSGFCSVAESMTHMQIGPVGHHNKMR